MDEGSTTSKRERAIIKTALLISVVVTMLLWTVYAARAQVTTTTQNVTTAIMVPVEVNLSNNVLSVRGNNQDLTTLNTLNTSFFQVFQVPANITTQAFTTAITLVNNITNVSIANCTGDNLPLGAFNQSVNQSKETVIAFFSEAFQDFKLRSQAALDVCESAKSSALSNWSDAERRATTNLVDRESSQRQIALAEKDSVSCQKENELLFWGGIAMLSLAILIALMTLINSRLGGRTWKAV